MPRPLAADFPAYYARYVSRVDADSLSDAAFKYADPLLAFYNSLPEEKAGYAYAPEKWTIKELMQHVVDTERIMSYRLLRIARKDETPLPSFDENSFAIHALANNRTFSSLKEELAAVRKSTDLLIASLSEEQLSHQGIASNLPVTANAVGFIIFGHLLHHRNVVEEKYL